MSKNVMFVLAILVFISVSLFFSGCSGNNSTSPSNSTTVTGHNVGQNCLTCHVSGGQSSENVFTLGGTIFKDAAGNTISPGTVVDFFSGPNGTGTLLFSLVADSSGNIHSSQAINFTAGIYPAIVMPGGTMRYMPQVAKQGSCNSTGCHDINTNPRIFSN
jgi:hypothetical protein